MLRNVSCLIVIVSILAAGSLQAAETVVLEPSADTTLYEGDGSLANGSGAFIFVGRTENRNGAVERRAVLAFDVGASVPSGATITEVSLELTMSRTISGSQTIRLHRLMESWGEGGSDASGQEGGGAPSVAGDATWVHRFFPDSQWITPGGSWTATLSSEQQVSGNGSYIFPSSAQMVADVQGWLDNPPSNFGWALVMPSPPVGGAKRFNSRENTSQNTRPKLTVTYEAGIEPDLPERYVFPASNAEGDSGAFFITSADILNNGPSTASIRIELLERNTDNSTALQSTVFTLEPGHVRHFDNLFSEAFGQDGEDVAGGAAVLSDSANLVVMTRTFNQVDAGTIGAALPGVSISELIRAGERVKVVFLSENDDFRSNLGLINGVDSTILVQWELFDSNGNSLGTGERQLPPYGVAQLDRVLGSFAPIGSGYAEVWTDTTGGAFTTYGSIMDEGTSDPTIVMPR